MRIKQFHSSLALKLDLPNLERCTSLSLPTDTVIISAGGFEDRTFALAKVLKQGGRSVGVFIRYAKGDEENRLEDLISALKEKGVIVLGGQPVDFDRFHPDFSFDQIRRILESLHPPLVIVDVSAMSKMAILLCLEVCRFLNLPLWVFYSEAAKYYPLEEEYRSAKVNGQIHRPTIQVYTGVGQVVRSTRLASVGMQGEPIAAIMFMSFNEMLTQALINSIYPSRLLLINGRPPEHKWREEATAWIHETLRKEWPEDDNRISRKTRMPIRTTSTLDYRQTVNVLLDLYWTLATDYRIVASPTGSKMQALGLYLARALHPDIHIEYPTPKGYLPQYSTGIGKTWIVRFGSFGSWISQKRAKERDWRLGIDSNAPGT